MDLIEYEFVEEVKEKIAPKADEENKEEPAAKKTKMEVDETETKMVKNVMKFVPLEDALSLQLCNNLNENDGIASNYGGRSSTL